MKHLRIQNFGPLKEVDICLKRFNLIIGPQSSGKSCVLKIASFCDWLERQIMQSQSPGKYCTRNTIEQNLIVFHKLVGYLDSKSFFSYETETMYFSFNASNSEFEFEWKEGKWDYRRPKIAYIPAERNLVAAIPNWFQVSMNNDNIMEFMKEWEFTRKSSQSRQEILNLGVSYEYDPANANDRILMDNGKKLEFTMTSSGIQSIIPLFMMANYLTNGYYKNPTTTVERDILRERMMDIVAKGNGISSENQESIVDSILNTDHTDLFIEEPEAHIFPSTQKSFVYSLSEMLGHSGRRHNCFLTTHSPYIMTSFNNLIFAGEIASENEDKRNAVNKVIPPGCWIDPQEVGAYAITNDGLLYSIIDEETNLISSDALDGASEEIGHDFEALLEI